jgi:hypothetical protein
MKLTDDRRRAMFARMGCSVRALRKGEKAQIARNVLYDVLGQKKQRWGDCYKINSVAAESLRSRGYIVLPYKATYVEKKTGFHGDKRGHWRIAIKYKRSPEKLKEEVGHIMRPVNTGDGKHDSRFDRETASRADWDAAAGRYVNRLAKAIKSEDKKVFMLHVSEEDLAKGVYGEGRHRILAAEKAGLKTMPVYVYKGR